MIRRYTLPLLLMFCSFTLIAQVNKNGIPFIKNYSTNDYNASEQNWAMCEDNRGVIYIGNNEGILKFDGVKWEKIPISNGSIVRSLAYSEGVVYAGGVNEFGYLAPNIHGDMRYISLAQQLDTVDFNDVWKIFKINNKVFFCTDRHIYMYKDKKLKKTYNNTKGAFLSFQVDNKIYWTNYYDNGLYELDEDTISIAKGGEFFEEKDIFTMLPWSENEILVGTNGQGIFIYNKETGLSKSLQSLGENYIELFNLLNDSQIYNGIRLSNGNYAVATLNNGCIVFSREGNIIYKLDKENGLQDITVINLFETSYGHLWLGLNKGISFVELNTPFTKLGQEYGIEGIIMDVVRFKKTLMVSTNLGVYYLDFDKNNLPFFNKVNFDRTVTDLFIFEDNTTKSRKLLLGSTLGLMEYKGEEKEPKKLSKDEYECEYIYQSKINPNYVYIGSKTGLILMEYKDGKWIDHKKVSEEITTEVISVFEDKNGDIWLGTTLKGIIRITKNKKVKRYGKNEGLPDLNSIRAYYVNEEIICTTNSGIYSYDAKNDKFSKYKGFGESYYKNEDEVEYIFSINNSEYWIVLKRKANDNIQYIEKITISQDRIVTIQDIPFKRLVNKSFYQIVSDKNNGVWIATSDGIYNYQEKLNDDFTRYYHSLIRKVQMGFDSLVFYGTYYQDTSHLVVDLDQPEALKIVSKYKDNSFEFFYSTPYMPDDEIKYSYKLEGFDENWSNWDSKTDNKYTNLSNGYYTFLVKAKNIYGIESEIIKYDFSIRPPWYKTLVAYFFYLILAVLVIIVIVKIYTRRLELEKIRLEQIVKERTEEVVKQKDEIEAQRDEIADKNRSITDSIEYASRIQTAVLPSNDFAKEILPEHFILFRPRDIVSGDFYWMTKKDSLLVVIAADCTGHGVPGAFMSMLGVSFLNEIVNRHEINSAGAILTQLRADVKKTLGQEGKEGEAKDGMDIALCIVDLEEMKMQYAGAYNPLYLYRDNELMEVKADRMPIGIYIKEKESFTNNKIDLQKGDVFYIFSDGFQDQFGGEDGSKFKTKNFKKLLLDIHQKPMEEQREILDTTIDEWRGEWEQIDDIIVLGVRV